MTATTTYIQVKKPTTPGQRGTQAAKHPHLYKGKPKKSLLTSKKGISQGGRNSEGRITVRHRSSRNHRSQLRLIDFKRTAKDNIAAKVHRIEYDPHRSAHIALVCYADGEWSYIIAAKGMRAGDEVMSGAQAQITAGNHMPLESIPVGTVIHNVEMRPGKGGQIARSAGSYVSLLGKESGYAIVRLRSGETRKIHLSCRATIGEVSNSEHSLKKFGKAGAKRWIGIRSTVRGVAMNPVDHPMGGGEGRTSGGRHPCSPWGWKTKGYKTRSNKRTDKFIVRSRRKAKEKRGS
ncbi:50S ribosomal protein L2 [Candidatus Synchoanobacter obligatus]|uniref:Large ribosomal subunit protein uL2 n=1 Tax=Candidatus Synchoanobacter obligatus TaxID=2919597 RepID=A0ABT1L5X3_9GAMM|nr:50S ribosomal protein L2 [Candidatus Synchoanobacter obligatus]MCP8352489.1 50S ribosomal protein L2 [Candidatus Synchoanobacter obligatus]